MDDWRIGFIEEVVYMVMEQKRTGYPEKWRRYPTL